jgi:NADH-quinone oxidoreductase subunit M
VVSLVAGLVAAKAYDFNAMPRDGALDTVLFNFGFAQLNFSLKLGADSLSLLLSIVTSLLGFCAILAGDEPAARGLGGGGGDARPGSVMAGGYYGWLLILMAALTGVWLSRDLLFFYGCFELILVPLFFLIGTYGGADRRAAAVKIFVYTFTGSILALPAILYLGLKAGTFDLEKCIAFAQTSMSTTERWWIVLGLLASFGVKTPIFPLHTWQPAAMSESPGNGVVDCVGLVLKLGAYAILKIAIPIGLIDRYGEVLFPRLLELVAILAVVGVLYGALVAWVQTDMKRLLAYSSLSHVGLVVLALTALTTLGVQAAGLYLINTAITTGALFLVVGMIYRRTGTRDMSELSGLGARMPVLSFFFGLFTMAAIGLPLLNGFVSEFLAILSPFKSANLGMGYGIAAAVTMVLGAVYMLTMLAKVLFGPVKIPGGAGGTSDINAREVMALAPLAVLVLVLGVFPTPVLNSLKQNVPSALTAPKTGLAQVERSGGESAVLTTVSAGAELK